MDNKKLREIWNIWAAAYNASTDLTERLVASDILDLIRELVAEKVVNACMKDATLNPDTVLKGILGEIGIKKKEWTGGRKDDEKC
jgi:hypothetical protein